VLYKGGGSLTPKFGCMLPLNSDYSNILEITRTCEQLCYDSVWAFDHLKPYWVKTGASLECWTTLASLAAHTKKIRLGSLVTNTNLRHPSLLAKITSTLDIISDGRLIVGLGTGDRLGRNELTSYGYRYGTTEERVERFRETVLILKGLWASNDFSFNGKFFHISHARLEPKPRQHPHPPLWIGGKHFKLMDIIIELADGWNHWNIKREQLQERVNYLRERTSRRHLNSNHIVESWSGNIPPDLSTNDLLDYLQKRSVATTEYFIGYFGMTKRKNLERFAEVVSKL
jgi:alkanesulfonate monooxygenase SsuD/methylene tetrahydromethanopterin reductase-like flavin-dependent oxidoreductase (luciferase family)